MKTELNYPAHPWIVAHRGARSEAPENTAAAFDAAMVYPIDGIELDIQMSKDHVTVLHHDYRLARIDGSRKRISDLPLADLRKYDWGSWYALKFRGQRILTLDQLLTVYGSHIKWLVEIKSYRQRHRQERSQVLALKVLKSINRLVPPKQLPNIFILSFDEAILRFAHQVQPNLQYVLNLKKPNKVMNAHQTTAPSFNRHLYGYCISINGLNRPFAQFVQSKSQKLMTYTCNTPRQVEKALAVGIDVIITDNPGWLTAFLGRS